MKGDINYRNIRHDRAETDSWPAPNGVMNKNLTGAEHFLHHGDMTKLPFAGGREGHDRAGFRPVSAGITPGGVMPPFAAIAADRYACSLPSVRHARNAAQGGAEGDTLNLRG